jgi:hypothetical protein
MSGLGGTGVPAFGASIWVHCLGTSTLVTLLRVRRVARHGTQVGPIKKAEFVGTVAEFVLFSSSGLLMAQQIDIFHLIHRFCRYYD